MAKIKKKDFTRGTKLTVEHWNANKNQLENVLSGNIDAENLTLNNGKFSVTYNWPRLFAEDFAFTSEVERNTHESARLVEESQGIYAVLLLPPTQDNWTSTIGTKEMPLLKSLSVSFDNYMQNWAVTNETENAYDASKNLKPVADSANLYTMNIEIREKDQSYNTSWAASSERVQNIAPKSIWRGRIEGINFNSPSVRFNPYYVTGIDKLFHPLKTYLIKIDFPDVFGLDDLLPTEDQKRYGIPSLTLKLDFETRMLERDRYDEDTYVLQNFPVVQQEYMPSIALDTAVVGRNITATAGVAGNGRIQLNAESIDAKLVEGLSSGQDLRSNPSIYRNIKEDASYFCLAVPMFSGFGPVRASDINKIGLPYGPQGDFGPENEWTGLLFDQRLIPISQPFTIHHVFAVHDYGSHFVNLSVKPWHDRIGSGFVPQSPHFSEQIGVGIASGLRSESHRYEQVAYMYYTGDEKFGYLVDQVVDGLIPTQFGAMTVNTTPGYQCDQEIFQVPLVNNVGGGAGTRSYYDQGMPYYVGKSDLNTVNRTDVGTISGTNRHPNTYGEELFIDVRWAMFDTTGLQHDGTSSTTKPPSTSYIGTSKCWVYIIGKMMTAL